MTAARYRGWGWFGCLIGGLFVLASPFVAVGPGTFVLLFFAGMGVTAFAQWWAYGPPVMVIWPPWTLSPVVCTNSPWDGSEALFRARALAALWEDLGRLRFLSMLLRASTRWALWCGVARAAVRAQKSHGIHYREPAPGVRLSVVLTAADWLAGTTAARALKKNHHDCYLIVRSAT